MDKKYLPFFLPIRSVIFILVFVIGALAAGKAVADIRIAGKIRRLK